MIAATDMIGPMGKINIESLKNSNPRLRMTALLASMENASLFVGFRSLSCCARFRAYASFS
jgi:hypothetical protein